jgi:hypothetical protein
VGGQSRDLEGLVPKEDRVLIYIVIPDGRPVLRIAQVGGEYKDYPLTDYTIKNLLRELATWVAK